MSKIEVEAEEVISGRKQFRAPFKVHLVEWNPVVELLALASQKGEIVVKRPGWKKCWKTCVGAVVENGSDSNPDDPRKVSSIAWNPSGNMLAVGMDDGHYHLIDVDTGSIRWTNRLFPKHETFPDIVKMRWHANKQENSFTLKDDSKTDGYSDEEKATASIEEKDEMISDLLVLEDVFFTSLQQSYLFCIRNDHKISVLAGGIVCVSIIDVQKLCESLCLNVSVIHDIVLSSDITSVSIAVDTYGPKPQCGSNGIFGVPTKESGVKGSHAYVFNVKWTFDDIAAMWRLVLRYLKTILRFRIVTSCSEKIIKEWSTASQIFMNRLNPSEGKFNFLSTLVTNLVSGLHSQQQEAVLEKHISNGIMGMREFLQVNFNDLLKSLNGPLASSIRCLAYQMEKFQFQLNMSKTFNPESALFPERNNDVNVYPFNCRENLSPKKGSVSKERLEDFADSNDMFAIAEQLVIKVREASIAGTANMKELQCLIRWLSLFPVLLRSNMKKTAVQQSKKIDTAKLWRYVVETFLEDTEYRTCLLRSSFEIDSIIEEMSLEEKEIEFSDEAYYRACPPLWNLVDQGIYAGLESYDDIMKQIREIKPPREVHGSNESPQSISDDEMLTSPIPKYQPFIDKISDFWSNELSDATLSLIYCDGTYNRLKNYSRKTTLTTLYNVVRRAIDSKLLSISELGKSSSINWIYAAETAPVHSQFTGMHLCYLDFSKMLPDSEKTVEHRPVLAIVGYRMEKCVMHLVLEQNYLPYLQGHQKTLLVEMNLGDTIVGALETNDENKAYNAPLTIATHEDVSINESIIEIASASCDIEGNFYVLVLGANRLLGTGVRRILKIHPSNKIWKTHNESFRMSQLDHLCISHDGLRGCSISDEQTKVALFNLFINEMDGPTKFEKISDEYMDTKEKEG